MNRSFRPVLLAVLLTAAATRAQTGPPMGIYKGLAINAVATGDFDLDGLPDGVFVTANDLHVELNHGIGNQPWPLVFAGEGGLDLQVVDLDLDGDQDVLVLKSIDYNTLTCSVRVLLNNAGSIAASTVTIKGRLLPFVADLDNDGLLDLLGNAEWNRATAPGVFASQPQALAIAALPRRPGGEPVTDPMTYHPGDFDGDGDIDLLSYRRIQVSGFEGHADLLLNDGSGQFAYSFSEAVSNPSFQVPGAQFVVADFDGDMIDDFIVEDTTHGNLVIHHGDPSGRFLGGRAGIPGLGHFAGLADLDGDGDLDLVVQRPASTAPFTPPNPSPPPSLDVIENLGHGVYREPAASTLSFFDPRFGVADFDFDGRDDFLFVGPYHGAGYGVALGAMTATPFALLRYHVGISGMNQSGPAGAPLPQPLVVEVRDAGGFVVPGETVTIAAEGQIGVPATLVTDAAGQISIPLGATDRVGSHRIEVSGMNAASRRFAVDVTPTRVVVPLGDFVQGGNLGGSFPRPLHLRVEDLAGVPQPGVVVEVTREWPSGTQPVVGSAFTTDANGEVSTPVSTGAPPYQSYIGDLGDLGVRVQAERAAPLEARLFTRRVFKRHAPNSSGLWVHRLRYHHEHIWTPLIMMADLPQPAPVSTIFGDWYTSFLSPQPTLYVLDGLGLSGPPVPGVVSAPRQGLEGFVFDFEMAWNLLPAGTNVVFQFLAYDNAYPFPIKVALSEPVTVSF